MKKVTASLLFVIIGLAPSVGMAQVVAFTQDLFEKKSHDFGTVARAAQIDYVFEFKNNTKNSIQVSAVRTSCNCTTPTIEKKVVEPGEKGGIRCRFNTRSFLGSRRATVTVSFSRPYFAEVQLEVKGYVRRDIVVHPPAIDFKNVKEGEGSTQKVNIEYAGKENWKIDDVKSSNPDIKVSIKETHRGNSLVGYELEAQLKPSAKPGYLNNFQILLKTNDKRLNEFPVNIQGNVEEAVSISPATIDASEISVGQSINKRLIIKADEEFQIVKVNVSDPRLKFDVPEASKKLHIVPVTLNAGKDKGPFSLSAEIVTDIGGVTKTVTFTGNVVD